MYKKTLISVNEIVKIKITGPQPTAMAWVNYVPEKRWFFNLIRISKSRPCGFSDGVDWPIRLNDVLNKKRFKDCFQDGENIMKKPSVTIIFNHQCDEIIYFDRLNDANDYVEDLVNEFNLNVAVLYG